MALKMGAMEWGLRLSASAGRGICMGASHGDEGPFWRASSSVIYLFATLRPMACALSRGKCMEVGRRVNYSTYDSSRSKTGPHSTSRDKGPKAVKDRAWYFSHHGC